MILFLVVTCEFTFGTAAADRNRAATAADGAVHRLGEIGFRHGLGPTFEHLLRDIVGGWPLGTPRVMKGHHDEDERKPESQTQCVYHARDYGRVV